MPKHVKAPAAQDTQEERLVRKLAGSHHAPADWKCHAKTGAVELGWQDAPSEIATELGCHPHTVRIPLKRFTREGVAGLGMRPGRGAQAEVDATGAQPHSRFRQAGTAWAPLYAS